jgi:hypothetical protein
MLRFSEDEVAAFIEEAGWTTDRKAFNKLTERFDAQFIAKFKARFPGQTDKFPFGSACKAYAYGARKHTQFHKSLVQYHLRLLILCSIFMPVTDLSLLQLHHMLIHTVTHLQSSAVRLALLYQQLPSVLTSSRTLPMYDTQPSSPVLPLPTLLRGSALLSSQ